MHPFLSRPVPVLACAMPFMAALLLLLLGLVCSAFSAQGLTRLSLEEALALAMAHNPGLQAQRQELAIGEAGITEAGRFPNPVIVSDNGIAEDTYRIGVQQLVELGGKRGKRRAVARSRMRTLADEIRQEELALRTSVRETYSRYYILREKRRLLQERTQNYRAFLNEAKSRSATDPLERIEAALIALSIENRLQEAILETEQARNELSFLLAVPLAEDLPLASPPVFQEPLPAVETLVARALANRPDYQELVHEQDVIRRETDLTRSLRIPDLTVAAGPDIVLNVATSAFIMAQLEVPVFDRQQGPLLELHARERQLVLQRQQAADRVALEVKNAWQACRVHRARLRNFEENLLARAEAIRKQARQRFEAGESSMMDLLSANEVALDTRLAYLGALLDYQLSIAQLERATAEAL